MRSLKEKRQHDYEIKMTMTYLLPFKQNDSQKVNVLLWPVSTKGFIISTQSFLKVRFRVLLKGGRVVQQGVGTDVPRNREGKDHVFIMTLSVWFSIP